MNDFLIGYTAGTIVGLIVSWFVMNKRLETGSEVEYVYRSVGHFAIVQATDELVTEDKAEQIRDRANEILEACDLPFTAKWEYKND